MLFEKFEPDGSLPSNNSVVIEGMHQGEVLSPAATESPLESLVVVRAVQNDIGTVAARGRHFDQRRSQRHTNLRSDAELASVISHALSMVSGRGRDDTPIAFFTLQQEQLVQRASLFEGSRALQVIELEINLVTGGLRKCL